MRASALFRLAWALAAGLFAAWAMAAPLKVGTDESLPPYSFVREGQAVGIDVDMLRLAAQRLQLEVEIVPLPWKRVLARIESGELPLAMPLFRTPLRERFALFTGPVHLSQSGLFVHRDRSFPFTTIDDLAGKRIGISRGFVIQDELDYAIRSRLVIAEEVGSIEQNLRKLLAGRIDAYAGNVVSTRYVLRQWPQAAELEVLPKRLTEARPAFLVVSRAATLPDRDQLVEALRQALEALHRDGTYTRLVEHYLRN